jgi:hypothetical protein
LKLLINIAFSPNSLLCGLNQVSVPLPDDSYIA